MRISRRWLPAIVTPAIIAGVTALPLQASAVDLPDLSADELMVMMQASEPAEFSGIVVKRSNLGLPTLELSSMLSEAEVERMREKTPEEFAEFVPEVIETEGLAEAMELIAGEHRVRVFVGETGMRAQILDRMSQRDLIVSGNTVWSYDSREQTATFAELDEQKLAEGEAQAMAELNAYAAQIGLDLTDPQAVSDYVMGLAGEDSVITVGTDHWMAGRTAYQLIVTPKSDVSMVASVVVSLDSETGMPLALSVNSVAQAEPAMEIAFESISFTDQDEALFSFTPPAGTEVTNLNELESNKPDLEMWMDMDEMEALERPEPEMLGEGWASVVKMSSAGEKDMFAEGLFAELMTEVAGGKVFTTPLVNVLVTDSGDIYAGAVTLDYLLSLAK